LGVKASLKAIDDLTAGEAAQRTTLASKLEQLEYEARRAFEQYDVVDARNRLAAAELERRWNEKLEEIEIVRQQLTSLSEKRHSLSAEEEADILSMGESFAAVWHSDRCLPALKKMIFRTVIEEIIIRADHSEDSALHPPLERRRAHADADGPSAFRDRNSDVDRSLRDHSPHSDSPWR
jgi:hypothetical protein